MSIKETTLYCDGANAIPITKNLVLHSRTKHVEVKYHFIRKYAQDGNIDIQYVSTE